MRIRFDGALDLRKYGIFQKKICFTQKLQIRMKKYILHSVHFHYAVFKIIKQKKVNALQLLCCEYFLKLDLPNENT